MKNALIRALSMSVLLMITVSTALAAPARKGAKTINAEKDIDTLGGNSALINMAAALDSQNRARIVQSRTVDRNMRFEFGLLAGANGGGDPYLQTRTMGASVDFHINPKFSLGARYHNYRNQLTAEGARIFDEARRAYNEGGRSYAIPDIDYPLESMMAVGSWYPVYGKINLFDRSIVQFDVYMLAGGGNMKLSSGSSPVYTAGGGMGFWFSPRWSARTEFRYQTHNDHVITDSRNIQTFVGTLAIGFLL